MATSLTDDFSLTRDEIIRAAFETIGVAVTNEPLNPDDVQVGNIALNVLATSWKSIGLQLWKKGDASETLVASQAAYPLTPTLGSATEKPMRIYSMDITDSDGNQIPVNRLSHQEYNDLPNLTTTGTPISFYFEPSRTTSTVYLWPVPDATAAATYTLNYTYQQPIQDMSLGTQDVDFPNEWYRALILNLALDLAPKYGLDRLERIDIKRQAVEALDLARDYDVEDTSIFFKPEGYRY